MIPESRTSVIAILAAGASRRLGQPKQLLEIEGVTLLQRMVDAARSSADEVWLAMGVDGDRFWNSLADHARLVRIHVPDAETGMSASIRALAIHAMAIPAIERMLIVLVDQYRVDSAWLSGMLARAKCHPDRIIASLHQERRSAPAVFPRSRFAELAQLSGDAGARELLRTATAEQLVEYPAPSAPGDIDRIEDLADALATVHLSQ